jgi:hypothetical protein
LIIRPELLLEEQEAELVLVEQVVMEVTEEIAVTVVAENMAEAVEAVELQVFLRLVPVIITDMRLLAVVGGEELEFLQVPAVMLVTMQMLVLQEMLMLVEVEDIVIMEESEEPEVILAGLPVHLALLVVHGVLADGEQAVVQIREAAEPVTSVEVDLEVLEDQLVIEDLAEQL